MNRTGLPVVDRFRFPLVDITGGAPELNAQFRRLVYGSRRAGSRVIMRHNLTVMFEPAEFAGRAVETGAHCFGCTAGAGSSCGGGVVKA